MNAGMGVSVNVFRMVTVFSFMWFIFLSNLLSRHAPKIMYLFSISRSSGYRSTYISSP